MRGVVRVGALACSIRRPGRAAQLRRDHRRRHGRRACSGRAAACPSWTCRTSSASRLAASSSTGLRDHVAVLSESGQHALGALRALPRRAHEPVGRHLAASFDTYPRLLQRAGYKTAFVGKWHMDSNTDAPRPGFDYWVSFKGQGVYENPVLNENGHSVTRTGLRHRHPHGLRRAVAAGTGQRALPARPFPQGFPRSLSSRPPPPRSVSGCRAARARQLRGLVPGQAVLAAAIRALRRDRRTLAVPGPPARGASALALALPRALASRLLAHPPRPSTTAWAASSPRWRPRA